MFLVFLRLIKFLKHTQIKDIHWDIYVTRANTNLSKLKSSLQQIYFDKRHINKAMLK